MLREVRAMGLTWRDVVSSAAISLLVLAYASFMFGSSLVLLSSAWTTSAVGLVLAAICAVFAAADLHTRPQPRPGRVARRITTVLGAIALTAGLAGLAANNAKALEVLVVAMGFLWLTGTLWHVYTIGEQ
jgi:hypothetical protein